MGTRRQTIRARPIDVLLALTASDLRTRYGRGAWRLVKWLVDPFAAVGVYLLLITFVLHRAGHAPGLSLACAVVPFQLVMSSVTNALLALQLRTPIILNMSFPKILIPASSTLTESVAFGASLLLLVLMMGVYSVAPTPAIVWLPVVLAITIAFSTACSYVASLLSVWLPDLRPFAVSFVRTLFFLAPGLVALPTITGHANSLVRINPLTGLFESFRAVLVFGHSPAAWQLMIPIGWTVGLFALVLPVYRSEARQVAKIL